MIHRYHKAMRQVATACCWMLFGACVHADAAAWEGDPATPPVCKEGYVPREAGPEDRVCVTPEVHARTVRENGAASLRVDPGGAYGPNTCIAGFVWREAFPGDVVCVQPEIRALVREDNRLSESRVERPGVVVQAAGEDAADPTRLCELRYQNFAWGRVQRGLYVDIEGNAFRYGIPPPPELDARRPVVTLDAEDLAKMRRLIEEAAAGKIGPKQQQGADQGSLTSRCWRYPEGGGPGDEVLLAAEGDWAYRNLSTAAAQLHAWLKRLGEAQSRDGSNP